MGKLKIAIENQIRGDNKINAIFVGTGKSPLIIPKVGII